MLTHSKPYTEFVEMDRIDSESTNISEHTSIGDKRQEALAWGYILYTIGSHAIKIARSLQNSSENPVELGDVYDDPLTRMFCGFWILWYIDKTFNVDLDLSSSSEEERENDAE